MKTGRLASILLVLLLLFTGCRDGGADGTEPPAAPEEPPASRQEPAPTLPEESPDEQYQRRREEIFREHENFLGGLSPQAMREDFDYFWDTVHTGYPFLGVLERFGVDTQEVYRESLRKLEEEVSTDLEFVNLFQWVAVQFSGRGHFSPLMGAGTYDAYVELYGEIAARSPHCRVLYETLRTPAAIACYDSMRPLEAALDEAYREFYGTSENIPSTPEDERSPDSQSTGNLTAELLEDGAVAYLKIRSFGNELVQADQAEIAAFFESVRDVPHLIIDLTGNGGGSDSYWNQNIVDLLLAEPVVWRQYALANSRAPHNQEYLAAVTAEGAAIQPIDQLPAFPAFQTDDLQYLDAFSMSEMTFEPGESSLRYPGQIWVLVDERVYSSSESFSMFCKATGFATLVGETTGGDGGGVDPNLFVLPNSGLAYRFSILYTINSDGSNSEEAGTTPDLFSASAQSALETCLEAIRSLESA